MPGMMQRLQIKCLTANKVMQAEARAKFPDKSVQGLQKKVDRLKYGFVAEQDKY